MRLSAGRWSALVTVVVTIVILMIAYPTLKVRYGPAVSLVLSGILVLGMALYYFRGTLFSRNKT